MGENLVSHVLLVNHETDEKVFVGQLLFVGFRDETIQHVVVLYGRVLADGIKATMVIGKHQSVRRHNDTRAKTTEVDNSILHGVVARVELFHRQLETIRLHLLIDGIGQVVERPHALISVRPKGTQTE